MTPTEFGELSRLAARGTLTSAERERLDAALREQPALRSELDWDRTFRDQLRARVEELPEMPGWERTERLLREANDRPRELSTVREPGHGLLDRLSDWFGSVFGLRPDFQVVAAAVVVVQAALIGVLALPTDDPGLGAVRSTAPPTVATGPLLRVVFRDDLREAELRAALASIGGEIVGGPGQLGVYLVRVVDGDLAATAERLRASGATRLVEVAEPSR